MNHETADYYRNRTELTRINARHTPITAFLQETRSIRNKTQDIINQVTEDIESDTADQLKKTGRAELFLEGEELSGVFSALIHHVSRRMAPLATGYVYPELTFVTIAEGTLSVRSLIHIHSPVTVFVPIGYELENGAVPGNLRLIDRSLSIETHLPERTGFLKRMIIERYDMHTMASTALSDPRQVILDTLPERLERHGYRDGISRAEISIIQDEMLSAVFHR